MKRTSLIATTALGLVLGAVLFNAPRAYAQLATIDVAAIAQAVKSVAAETGILDVIQAMQTVQQTMSDTMKAVNTALGTNTYGDTNTLLLQGFTQNANYSKAQVGAIQQIVDASNTANARFARDMRNAQIRDEQTASPTHCAAIDGGVSTQSASIGAFQVGQTMAAIHDTRGEAGPGMPSYYGQAQGVASMWAAHVGQYCDTTEGAANLCPNGVSANPDADQKASNLFGNGAYADQTAVNTAKDVAVNLIQPVAPAALRGDQLASVSGQDAAVRRHGYNTRMSLAQTFVDNAVAMQVPAIPLTATQTQYMQNMGLSVPASGNGSWLQVLQIESERRISDVSWHAALQNMPPAAVEREVALELALNNYLLFETYKVNLQHAAISATHLAEDTDRNFMPTSKMSTPSMVSN